MKKLLNKVLVVLAMTSAIVANVNAATPAQVQTKVDQVIGNLKQPRSVYSTTQRNQDIQQLKQYAKEYPTISSQLDVIISALNLASGDARKATAMLGGTAYNAQQNIKDSMSQPMATVATPRRTSVSRPMTQAPAATPALLNQQAKEVSKAVADLQLAQNQAADKAEQEQKKIIAAKTETAKQNAQLNADKAVEMANAKVAEKAQIATEKLEKLNDSIAQANQPVLTNLAHQKLNLAEHKELAPNAADKKELQGEIISTDAQMTQEEQAQGTTGWKASIYNAVSANKKALIALGIGVAGTAAAYGAYEMGYVPSTETMKRYGRTGMDYVSSTARGAYDRLPSLPSRETGMSYAPSRSALGYGVAGTTAIVGTGLAVKKYRTGEKEVTPADVSKSAAAVEVATKTVNATEAAAQKNPSEVNLQKAADAKADLEVKAARAADDLEAVRTWTGDLRGYSLEDVNRAKVALGLLYPQEKQLKEMLGEIKNDPTYLASTSKAQQTAAYSDVNKSLKQVQQQIHDNEVITGKRYANAIKRSIYALSGAAVLGAAAALALDYKYNESNLMKSAAGYGSAALATGTGYVRSGVETARGYGSRLYTSAAEKAQAAKEAAQRLWYGTPEIVRTVGTGVVAREAINATPSLRANPARQEIYSLDPAMTEVYEGDDNSYMSQIKNPVSSAITRSTAAQQAAMQQRFVAPTTTRQFAPVSRQPMTAAQFRAQQAALRGE